MYKFYFDKKPVVENCQITNISVFVRHNLLELNKLRDGVNERKFDLNTEADVRQFIDLVEKNIKLNLRQEINGKIHFSEVNSVKLTYTRSNLNRGFIFWFVCNICGKKVRNLYFPSSSEILACRNCHRLAYKSQNRRRFRESLRV